MTKVDTLGLQEVIMQSKIKEESDNQRVQDSSYASTHLSSQQLKSDRIGQKESASRSFARTNNEAKALGSTHLFITKFRSYSSISTTSSIDEENNDSVEHVEEDRLITRLDDAFIKKLGRRVAPTFKMLQEPFQDTQGNLFSLIRGLFYLSVCGIILGLVMPKNQELHSTMYQYASSIIGYTYSTFWCVSFYPQLILNFQRKSTEGVSVDFAVVNFIGFICYASYTCCFYWNKTIQDMYRERNHHEGTGANDIDSHADGNYESIFDDSSSQGNITVQSNDVAFAIHAVILSSVWLIQLITYGGTKMETRYGKFGVNSLRAHLPISFPFMIFISGTLSFISMYATLVYFENKTQLSISPLLHDTYLPQSVRGYLNWLDFLYFLSLVKMLITVIKYMPQVALNARYG